jgi:hypothetical protein
MGVLRPSAEIGQPLQPADDSPPRATPVDASLEPGPGHLRIVCAQSPDDILRTDVGCYLS